MGYSVDRAFTIGRVFSGRGIQLAGHSEVGAFSRQWAGHSEHGAFRARGIHRAGHSVGCHSEHGAFRGRGIQWAAGNSEGRAFSGLGTKRAGHSASRAFRGWGSQRAGHSVGGTFSGRDIQ